MKRRVPTIDIFKDRRVDLSAVGVSTSLPDYSLAMALNLHFKLGLENRALGEPFWEDQTIWRYSVYDGAQESGEGVYLVSNTNCNTAENSDTEPASLFETQSSKRLINSAKHWDYFIICENQEFALDLEHELKHKNHITTAQFFDLASVLNKTETQLLYAFIYDAQQEKQH